MTLSIQRIRDVLLAFITILTAAIPNPSPACTQGRIDTDKLGDEAVRIHQAMQERPVATAAQLAKRAKISIPTVIESLRRLEELNIVNEVTGRPRYRVYTYEKYLGILSEGTEPLYGSEGANRLAIPTAVAGQRRHLSPILFTS